MNSLIIFSEEFNSLDRIILRDDRAQRFMSEQRPEAGAVVHLAEWGGQRLTAEVVSVERDEIILKVTNREAAPKRLPVTLCVAVPRPQTVKKVLSLAAQFGIERLVFFKAYGTVKSYLDSRTLEPEQIKDEIVKGLEQVWDPVAPEVLICSSMNEFFSQPWLLNAPEHAVVKIVADREGAILKAVMGAAPRASYIIAIGPESGWTEGERSAFGKYGFIEASLGERSYRVELAAAAFLAVAAAG